MCIVGDSLDPARKPELMQDFDRGDLIQGTHSDRVGRAERTKWDGEATWGQVAAGSFNVSGAGGTKKEVMTPEPRIIRGH